MNEKDFKQLNFSVLGKGSQLEGDLKFQGDTILNCRTKGSITMLDESKLVLERGSIVEGEVYCHDVEIFGSFYGTLNAAGTLCIRSSAVISGKINAKKMSIYPGASINMEGHTNPDEEEATS